ncbi:PTS transporter subunit EIIB [Streptococcus ovuberis]|uniref:PTS transporter subunit EIIB n=1 Tax=Streptococcus ovuberis TaxID=1936207 RepID=A0A7X6MZB0_9STRE|nr:PTS transporter subunit EIIB [Streptococcus ovuberis]NKZ20203.1 PTS transporter subunit EIIB [Streptococcus ovuberis]
MTNETLAQNILDLVGGPENVTRATHCATRLRLVLKDESKVQKEAIDGLEKVNGSVFAGGQYQVIIGLTVPAVHEAFLKAMGTPMTDVEAPSEKEQGNLFNRFFKSIVGIMTPTFGIMGAAGILKGLLALAVAMKLLQPTDGAYQIWYAVAQSFFYFLPIWVGFNASKVFGGSQFIGAALGASLVFPDIIALQTAGESISFFGIPVVLVNYTQSLFPAMVAAFVAAKIEKFLLKEFMKQSVGCLHRS